jgi:hypothetical protein
MYYSFHIIEAMASFKKAERFDNNNAMIFGRRHYHMVPILMTLPIPTHPDAFEAAQKAIKLSGNWYRKGKSIDKSNGGQVYCR